MDHFATDNAPSIGTRQAGGEAPVFQNGVAVFAPLFHQVGFPASLTTDHLIVAFPDVGIFSIQIRPTLRPLQYDLVVIIMDVAQRIDGTDRLWQTLGLFLVQLHFVSLQAAITLCDIHVASKHGVIWVIPFRVIGSDGNR